MAEHGFQDNNPKRNPGIQSNIEVSLGSEDDFNYDVGTLLLQSHNLHKAAKDMHLQHGKIQKRRKKKNTKKLEKSESKYHSARGNCTEALKRVMKVFQKHENKGEHEFEQEQSGRPKQRASSVYGTETKRPKIPDQFRCENCSTNIMLKEKLQRDVNDAREELRAGNKKVKQLEGDLNKVLQQIEQLHAEKERLAREISMEKKAKDDALSRLSAIASSKLRDNNPNIADLSDQNRPTKIAEKLSELYDNQWTDAYGLLEGHLPEEQITDTLLSGLMNVYKECRRLSTEGFFERVHDTIIVPKEVCSLQHRVVLPDQLKQQIKEFRKTRAVHVIKEIEKVVTPKIDIPCKDNKEIKTYLSRCVEVGWLCVVQDPPLVLCSTSSTEFDTNMFKDYVNHGRYTEYVVWPALMLHENGPLLAKGVAQGCNSPGRQRSNMPAIKSNNETRVTEFSPVRTRSDGRDSQAHHASYGFGQHQHYYGGDPSRMQPANSRGQVQSNGRSAGVHVVAMQNTNKSHTIHSTRIKQMPTIDPSIGIKQAILPNNPSTNM